MNKKRITQIGQPCRKCGTPVINKVSKRTSPKPGRNYYYADYLYCPNCKTMYFSRASKVYSRCHTAGIPNDNQVLERDVGSSKGLQGKTSEIFKAWQKKMDVHYGRSFTRDE